MGTKVGTPMSLDDKLKNASLPYRDVRLCINGELASERERLEAEILAKRARRGDRLSGDGAVAALRKQLDDVEARIREETITIRLTSVGFRKYNEYRHANPPAKGQQGVFNPATFFLYVARRSGEYVEGDTVSPINPAQWDQIEAGLTDAEHEKLAAAVVAVNRDDSLRGIDFLESGSGETRTSSETSDSPETLE